MPGPYVVGSPHHPPPLDTHPRYRDTTRMRADRLISLLILLQTNGRMTADDLAERLEVSTRTIYRDLDALSAAGVPVYAERGPQGGCMLMESYRTSLTGLKENEVRALFMLTVPGLLADLGADKDSESAFLKLTAALPAPFQQDAKLVQERLYLDPSAWFQAEEPTPFLATVQEAVFSSRRLRLIYRRADGQWVKRLIAPYGLVAKAGIWYLVGAVYAAMPQVFRISRIQEAELSESSFERPSAFNLAKFWTAWHKKFESQQERFEVKVRVEEQAIQRFAHYYGEGLYERLQEPDSTDESGALVITLHFESPEQACAQLLSLGTAVEVIEPDSLREQIRHTAVDIAAHYSQPRKP